MSEKPTTLEQQHSTDNVGGFEIPDIYCPFPAEINQHFDDVEAQTMNWAQETGLIDEEATSSDGQVALRFACCIHPEAPYQKLRFISKWYYWGFLEDDYRDESAFGERSRKMVEYQQPLLDVLEGEGSNRNRTPIVRAFADLHHQWTEIGSTKWQERFRRHHVRYFAAHRWEAHNRARNYVPLRGEYIRNTRLAAGMPIVFDLAALAGDVDRPPSFYRSPMYQDLLEAAGNIICWTNDVYSLRKELLQNEVNNLVVVVREEKGYSLQAAVIEVCELIAAETRRFEELRQRITEEFDEIDDLQSHLTQLEKAVSGHLKYSREAARYAVSD